MKKIEKVILALAIFVLAIGSGAYIGYHQGATPQPEPQPTISYG